MTPDIKERFRAEVISQLARLELEPRVIEEVLRRVDTVPLLDDVEAYVAVAAEVLRAALQPTVDAASARIAKLDIIEAFYSAETSKTVH